MFEVGDLVRFKASNINQGRYNPKKKLGIVVSIKRNMIESMWGKKQDVIIVRWLPWDQEEKTIEFYLEHMTKTS